MADSSPPFALPHSFTVAQMAGPLPRAIERPVIAVGNFDGLHRGHRAVIKAAQDLAGDLKRPAAVLTFEPHPRTFFMPDRPVFRLTPEPVQAIILQKWGLDGMVVATFDASLAATTAAAFVDDLLVRALGVGGIAVGHDFHFGKGRGGSPQLLLERGKAHAVPVVVVNPVTGGEQPISSSRIRTALETGDIAEANGLLGYRWLTMGRVRHGDKRGRTLGYPTANVRLPDDCRLRHGIYAVRAAVEGRVYGGVASFGKRPTFDDGAPLLEVHLFDVSNDLYERDMRVEFCGFIRGEERFASAAELRGQMDRDADAARGLLREPSPSTPSMLD